MYMATFAFLVLQGFVHLSSGGDLAIAVSPTKICLMQAIWGERLSSVQNISIVFMTALIELNH